MACVGATGVVRRPVPCIDPSAKANATTCSPYCSNISRRSKSKSACLTLILIHRPRYRITRLSDSCQRAGVLAGAAQDCATLSPREPPRRLDPLFVPRRSEPHCTHESRRQEWTSNWAARCLPKGEGPAAPLGSRLARGDQDHGNRIFWTRLPRKRSAVGRHDCRNTLPNSPTIFSQAVYFLQQSMKFDSPSNNGRRPHNEMP
jgi:hypothetical protein